MTFEEMEGALKRGVDIVVAPQLFETPQTVAYTVVREAQIFAAGMSVLEPSAGTGRLLAALDDFTPNLGVLNVHAVEVDAKLAALLRGRFPNIHVHHADFLDWTAPHKFDRIIANPPFTKGSDIRHIKRMISLLAPGGRLVSICANGPRQHKEIRERSPRELGADVIDFVPLPSGTFRESGTNVAAAIAVLQSIEAAPARRRK